LRVALCGRKILDGILAKAAMKLFVGVTNNDWFRFLAERNPEEVNFRRPRIQNDFKALRSGDIFLFEAALALDFIAGGGDLP